MIEAGANEVPEDKMIEAIYGAHGMNGEIIKSFYDAIVAECGKEKHDYVHFDVPEDLWADLMNRIPSEEMEKAVFTDEKQVRENNIRVIKEKLEGALSGDHEEWLPVHR